MIIHVKNLDDIRLLENKMMNDFTTVVFFFMDGCFHCENMKPSWNKFEKMYENDENNTIAMIESNHIQHMENKPDIIGFPTIFKYKNNHPIEYSGDRSTKSFVKFADIKVGKPKKSRKSVRKPSRKSVRKPSRKSTRKSTKSRKSNKKQKVKKSKK